MQPVTVAIAFRLIRFQLISSIDYINHHNAMYLCLRLSCRA